MQFSGGKDSLAAMLLLLELGVSPERIENHHHEVDGREGSRLMDWPVTHSYMQKVSAKRSTSRSTFRGRSVALSAR
jgi:diphthamide synthase (EF-2-diphthine--ammonia ligase)